MDNPVIRACAFCLSHVPQLVQHGSKPRREIAKDPSLSERLSASLRDFDAAVRYPPNQVFIGNSPPESLAAMERPWHQHPIERASSRGTFGEILPQDVFYALLERADVLTPPLVTLASDRATSLHATLEQHEALALLARSAPRRMNRTTASNAGDALALADSHGVLGWVRRDDRAEGREDRNLDAPTLLEALCTKASGAIALGSMLNREQLDPQDIDYLISCGEEAVGDRYQRGGGGIAKAIGELCGCTRASGMDIKNFCAAPACALVTAGALVKAGVYERVAVVAGGSLAKLGMKFRPLLDDGQPILGDCLGSMAILVTRDDGVSPTLHLEPGCVGIASIGASSSDEAIYRELILGPLERLGLQMTDVDRFAPELHNAELMEYAGSGDVARKNYRMIAAMAVLAGAISKQQMSSFIERVGMPGFAPPQGHIPSGVPYLGHAMRSMARGDIRWAMFICKASLFLNRLTTLYDGVSFMVEGRAR